MRPCLNQLKCPKTVLRGGRRTELPLSAIFILVVACEAKK
jgi:hypothetical protein